MTKSAFMEVIALLNQIHYLKQENSLKTILF